MLIPTARGSLSAMLFDVMRAPAADDAPVWAHLQRVEPDDDGDAQIALWTMYELAYRGFDDAPERCAVEIVSFLDRVAA